eukprot:IDg12993t1
MSTKATYQITSKGNITVARKVNSKRHTCILKDVLRVPDLVYQLFSVANMDKLGVETSFKIGRCPIKAHNRVMGVSFRSWHENLEQVYQAGIKQMIDNGVVTRAAINSNENLGSLRPRCIMEKSNRTPIPKIKLYQSQKSNRPRTTNVVRPLEVKFIGDS